MNTNTNTNTEPNHVDRKRKAHRLFKWHQYHIFYVILIMCVRVCGVRLLAFHSDAVHSCDRECSWACKWWSLLHEMWEHVRRCFVFLFFRDSWETCWHLSHYWTVCESVGCRCIQNVLAWNDSWRGLGSGTGVIMCDFELFEQYVVSIDCCATSATRTICQSYANWMYVMFIFIRVHKQMRYYYWKWIEFRLKFIPNYWLQRTNVDNNAKWRWIRNSLNTIRTFQLIQQPTRLPPIR